MIIPSQQSDSKPGGRQSELSKKMHIRSFVNLPKKIPIENNDEQHPIPIVTTELDWQKQNQTALQGFNLTKSLHPPK